MTQTAPSYSESSIRILEGLEPVRLRPGQFTRTDSPLHIVQEVLDNAVDEALAGHAKYIHVTLLPDNGARIADDGRGIPVGAHPEKKIPVVQAIFTVLYSGGKFDKKGSGAYTYSGGLHGVGVSVTNALSRSLVAEVVRDGWLHRIGFGDGEVVEPLKRVEKREGSGTAVTVYPNPKYFDTPEFDPLALRALLKSKAVLLPGLTVVLRDERVEPATEEAFAYERGLVSYLGEIAGSQPLTPVISSEAYVESEEPPFSEGEGASWAFGWYESTAGSGASYVNLIPTPDGGTHVSGLRSALFNAVRTYIEHHSMLPKGVKLTADDVFKNVHFVLSARMLDPSFDNQTKDRLNHRDGVKLIERVLQPRFEGWLNQNGVYAKAVAELAISNASARQRAAVKTERKKSSGVVLLPGKLADCESSDASRTELFLVEGDSAGGSAKMGRDKDVQAILPMRGKSLNVWEKTKAEALTNDEIHDISVAIGIDPHTATEQLDFGKLRYGKVCILADADVDGFHIQTLLLTLFYRHFPQLIARGHIYVARPPLYRIDTEGGGKKRPLRKVYAMDEQELQAQQERLRKEGYPNQRIGRFKGLGEMDPPELWDTTLNPDTRRLLKVILPSEMETEAQEAFEHLMGKSNADWRKGWMERRGAEIESF